MVRKFTPKVVTANDLLEGDVVYLAVTGDWSLRHEDAALFTDEVAANEALALAHSQPNRLVGAYLANAIPGPDDKPKPVHFREVFRTKGPSNYADHGKQAEL